MINKLKKAESCGCSPYAGSGSLSDYKKDGSWIMNQIEKGYDKVQRGITVDNSGDYIRYASSKKNKQCRIASNIIASAEQFKIVKNYKQLSSKSRNDYRFAMRWSIFGNLDGSTLEDLNIVKELLLNRVGVDQNKLTPTFNTSFDYCGQACIDFKQSCIKVEAIISFEVNIITDVKQITEFLNKLGFDAIDELKMDKDK